jgi:hypothetical protein
MVVEGEVKQKVIDIILDEMDRRDEIGLGRSMNFMERTMFRMILMNVEQLVPVIEQLAEEQGVDLDELSKELEARRSAHEANNQNAASTTASSQSAS